MSINTSIANSIPMTDEASEAFAGFVDFLNEEVDHPERVILDLKTDRTNDKTFYVVAITNEPDSINVYITEEGHVTMILNDTGSDGGIRVIHTGEFINRINHMTSGK